MDSHFHFIQRHTTLKHAQLAFASDVVPEQCYDPKEWHRTRGEVALHRAVLEDAFACFQKQFVTSRREALRLAQEAEAWFFTDDPHWPFSFVNICIALELNPGIIRHGLRYWRQYPPAVRQRRRRDTAPARRPIKVAA